MCVFLFPSVDIAIHFYNFYFTILMNWLYQVSSGSRLTQDMMNEGWQRLCINGKRVLFFLLIFCYFILHTWLFYLIIVNCYNNFSSFLFLGINIFFFYVAYRII